MAELKTEPAFALPRVKRPWWAAALVGGVGAGAAIAGALGLSSLSARGQEPPPMRTSSVAAAVQSDAEWRREVSATLADLRERMARIEGRLERR